MFERQPSLRDLSALGTTSGSWLSSRSTCARRCLSLITSRPSLEFIAPNRASTSGFVDAVPTRQLLERCGGLCQKASQRGFTSRALSRSETRPLLSPMLLCWFWCRDRSLEHPHGVRVIRSCFHTLTSFPASRLDLRLELHMVETKSSPLASSIEGDFPRGCLRVKPESPL